MIDDRTPGLDLPLPNVNNYQDEDVPRLRAALTTLDSVVVAKADLVAGKVPASQLPSYVDDVLEYANLAAFPATGEGGKIYVAIDTGKTYRWSGSAYGPVSDFVLLPATPTTLGGVKVGSGLGIDPEGVLYAVGGGGGSGLPVYGDSVLTPTVANQTTFAVPGGYNPGQLDVLLNGTELLGDGDDYTASDGVNIVLTTGISTPSKLKVRKWIYLPASQAVNKTGDTLTGALNDAPQVDVASAATCNIGLAASNRVRITGTTGITSFGTVAAGVARAVTFAGALTLTHNATSLILPGAANITTAAGDTAEFESLGAGNWRCTWYQRADGKALVGSLVKQEFSDIAVNTAATAMMRYRLTASLDLTLPAAPADGDWVDVVNHSGTTTARVLRNGQNIGGLAEDLTIDALNAALTLVFRTGYGWIIK